MSELRHARHMDDVVGALRLDAVIGALRMGDAAQAGRPSRAAAHGVAAVPGTRMVGHTAVPTTPALQRTPDGYDYCSFSGDTAVATADGDVPISEVDPGDQVLAYNETTGATNTYTVTATWAHEDPVVTTVTLDGEAIETTPEHPFYVEGFLKALLSLSFLRALVVILLEVTEGIRRSFAKCAKMTTIPCPTSQPNTVPGVERSSFWVSLRCGIPQSVASTHGD